MSAQHRVPVILTRAKAQAARFAAELPADMVPIFSPLLDIEFLPLDAELSRDETLLFTSENGVAALAASGAGLPGQQALCVGDRTAQAARTAGLEAASARGTAQDLVALALRGAGPFVHIRGSHARGDVAAQLRAAGKACREVIAYAQRSVSLTPEALTILRGPDPCLVPLFSPRTAALFVAACPSAPHARLICISKATQDAVTGGDYAVSDRSAQPDAGSVLDALCCHLKAIRLEAGGAPR
jgi:uroporphyrinogen-III synthase